MAEQIVIETVYGPVEALHWYLTDREIMWQALKELLDEHGHRGAIVSWPDVSGEQVYRIELNDDQGNTAAGQFGEHLVLVPEDRLWCYTPAFYESVKHDEGEQ